MDAQALALSLKLAVGTAVLLLPLAVVLGRVLAWRRFAGKPAVEALLALPLVLPPTVLGFYLLTTFAPNSPLGALYQKLFGATLAGVACAIGLGLRTSVNDIPRLASRGAVAAMLAVAALDLLLVASRLS